MVEESSVRSAFDRLIDWAWRIRNPDRGWGRAKDAPSTFSDSAELLFGLIRAGMSPVDKRMIESITFVKNRYLSSDKSHPPYSDWTTKPHAFKYHMFVALLLLESGSPREDNALLAAVKSLGDYRSGDGWCSDKDASETNVYDTVYAINALTRLDSHDYPLATARSWLESIQNKDGGWGFVAGERSNPACTALAISTLVHGDSVAKGVRWLKEKQLEEGRWRITYELGMGHADAYLYNSTGYALNALMLAGEDPRSDSVQKAVRYLLDIQSKEGGWYLVGEEKLMPPCEKLQALVYISAQAVNGLREYLRCLAASR